MVGASEIDKVYAISTGRLKRSLASPTQTFLSSIEQVSDKVFDAVRDFGAKGDGTIDDTLPIQATIDAAKHFGHGATAYLPTGRYSVSKSILVNGANYVLEGSGSRCALVWHGKAGEPFINVSDAKNVTLANFSVGHQDFGRMIHGDDIWITSTSNMPCRLILDGIYAYGKYQDAPDTHGIHFFHLLAGSVIDARMVQGNIRVSSCSDAELLFRTSYEGTVTIEGGEPKHDGLICFLTRLTTQAKPPLRVLDNQSVIMSDFYVEGSETEGVAMFSGSGGQPAGAVTIQSPKLQTAGKSPMVSIRDYSGRIYFGQSQFYCTPPETEFRRWGSRPTALILAGNIWYRNRPTFELAPATDLMLIGNGGVSDSKIGPASLAAMSAGLDDLRRLGSLDAEMSQAKP